jgi:hypothetical protein
VLDVCARLWPAAATAAEHSLGGLRDSNNASAGRRSNDVDHAQVGDEPRNHSAARAGQRSLVRDLGGAGSNDVLHECDDLLGVLNQVRGRHRRRSRFEVHFRWKTGEAGPGISSVTVLARPRPRGGGPIRRPLVGRRRSGAKTRARFRSNRSTRAPLIERREDARRAPRRTRTGTLRAIDTLALPAHLLQRARPGGETGLSGDHRLDRRGGRAHAQKKRFCRPSRRSSTTGSTTTVPTTATVSSDSIVTV